MIQNGIMVCLTTMECPQLPTGFYAEPLGTPRLPMVRTATRASDGQRFIIAMRPNRLVPITSERPIGELSMERRCDFENSILL